MTDLPFATTKRNKAVTKYNWKKRGTIFDNNFEEWYERYIKASHCELCEKKFEKRHDRCLDHNHDTGEPRNIVCQQCNNRKPDKQLHPGNTTGINGLYVKKNGSYTIELKDRDSNRIIKTSKDINKLIEFRNDYLAKNPNHFS
jgi:hypothetical protein